METLQEAAAGLEVERLGSGEPILFLHGEDGLLFTRLFLERLAERYTVFAPSHPAWGGSPRPRHVGSIDDIAYVYLQFLEDLDAGPMPVVGVSLGGWLAAEIAVKSQERIAALALVSPIGIKVRGRDDLDFVDIYARPHAECLAALYANPGSAPDLSAMDDEGFLALGKAQEAVARFAWQPYMHNPKLLPRLSRIGIPTLLVSGERDRFVFGPEYYERYAAAIPGALHEVVPGAGHRVEEEVPDAVVDAIGRFLTTIR
jgi:pimeloyl-ACP methyl ester carboxylesterase